MRNVILIVCVIMGLGSAAMATPNAYFDDFSSDTTDDYDTHYWLYGPNPQTPTPDVEYDSTNQRAELTATGGYSRIVMTQKDSTPISAGTDFEFSVDLSIIREYNSGIYLGDLQDPAISTHLAFQFDTYAQHAAEVEILNAGQQVHFESLEHQGNSASLKVKREGGVYSFLLDDDLVWQTTISTFDGLPLHYGVRNIITSGSSGVTATTAVDNWNFVPEPATLSFLTLGGLAMIRRRRGRCQ